MTTKSQARKTAFGLGGGFPIGRVAGIDIFVHWSWLIVFALLTASLAEGLFLNDYPSWSWEQGWLAGAATSLVVFGCVLVHELSHSIIARRRGMDVSSITLFIFGGVSTLKDEPRGPGEEFVIAAVGPMTSFVLGGLFGLGALVLNGGLGSAASYLAFINVVLGGFNLLPGFPLDGGRVLRAAAWARSHDFLKATHIAAATGTVVAYMLMIGGLVALVLGGVLLSAVATERIGIHAVFGAFLFGAVVPHDSRLANALKEKLEDLVTILLLPAFFAFTGMRTQIGLLSSPSEWMICGLIVFVATAGKFGGTLAAARFTGMGWHQSASLGMLMNTRGLMELIVLNIGLDLRVISPTIFAMMVIMALVTTMVTTPVLQLLGLFSEPVPHPSRVVV